MSVHAEGFHASPYNRSSICFTFKILIVGNNDTRVGKADQEKTTPSQLIIDNGMRA